MDARPKIAELLVLSKNDTLIQHYSSALRTDHDRDILGGMLTADQAFVQDAFSEKDGALDEMRYGNHTVCFVRDTQTIAAAVVEGDRLAAKYVVFDSLKDFEEKYQDALKNWDGRMDAVPGIDDCFAKVLRS